MATGKMHDTSWKAYLGSRHFLLAVLPAVVVTLAVGALAARMSALNERGHLYTNLERRVLTASVAFDASSWYRFTASVADLNDPEFDVVLTKLRSLTDTSSDIRFARIYTRSGNDIILSADSTVLDEPAFADIGSVVIDAPPALRNSFTGIGSTIGEVVFEGPLRDSRGSWITGFTPILDPGTFDVIGVLALHADASLWAWRIVRTAAPYLIISILASGLVLFFSIHSFRMRQAALRLAMSERRFRDMALSCSDWLWEMDENDVYTYCSDGIERVTGVRAAEVVGKTPYDFTVQPDSDQFRAKLDELRETGGTLLEFMRRVRLDDGREFVLRTSCVPTLDEQGRVRGFRGVNINMTERLAQGEQIRRLSRALESTAEAVAIFDRDQVILDVNESLLRQTGFPRGELVGAPADILLLEPLDDETRAGMRAVLGAGGSWQHVLWLIRRDGPSYEAAVNVSPIIGEEGEIEAFVALCRDITQEREAQREAERRNRDLEKARTDAENALRVKNEFLANVSHEIRTPMNAVLGMTTLLLDTELNVAQREYAEIVRNAGGQLLGLINDILDFSKIESGHLRLESIDFDTRTCLEEVVDLLGARAFEKDIELALLVRPSVPERIIGDPTRLRQVVQNLVSNAVKFTHKGHVIIEAEARAGHDREHVSLFISVTDTGIGIPEEQIPELFEMFHQLDSSMTRKYGGTGLGLSICKRLVAAMGGMIEVRSRVGEGSVFSFRVEVGAAPPHRPADTGRRVSLRDKHVLVVDDHGVNRFVMGELLRTWKCRCTEATSAAEAVGIIAERHKAGVHFDIALVDHNMPDFNSESLARDVFAIPGLPPLPLVILTSIPRAGDAMRMRDAGFNAYLTKPVKADQLLEALVTVLARPRSGSGDEEGTERKMVTRHLLAEKRRGRVRILVVEDNKVNQMVAIHLLEKMGHHADVASDGGEALVALRANRYDLVLMDCQMPGMDGFQATREIRKGEMGSGRRTVIVAMTAGVMSEDRENCLVAGMDDFLGKPIQEQELQAILTRHLPPSNTPGPEDA